MRPARESELCQHVGQDVQQGGLLLIHRDNAVQAAAVPTQGLNDVQAFELGDDAPGGHCPKGFILAHLTLQQAVDEQGQHVDEQHSLNALVLVQIDGRDLEVAFGNLEAFLDAVFLAIELQHAQRRPPLLSANAAEVGRFERAYQAANLVARQHRRRDDHTPYLAKLRLSQPASHAAS